MPRVIESHRQAVLQLTPEYGACNVDCMASSAVRPGSDLDVDTEGALPLRTRAPRLW
jgi:hypothetical protein